MSTPTGPPPNLSIMADRISLSSRSSPIPSISRASSPSLVVSMSMIPLPFTCEKSRIRFNILLATLGVPRDLLAISATERSSASIPSIAADRLMISESSSAVYISNLLSTPNLSLSGAERLPARVVAPIRVNFDRSSLIDLAEGPLPMTMSRAKSSMAEYRTSSTERLSLWISSIKSTSFSLRFVSIAARSPALSMAGPDVILISTPSSLAIMPARVVFPSPGGP